MIRTSCDTKYDESGKILISYNGYIPEYLVEEGVECIGKDAFRDNDNVEVIVLANSVRHFESSSFLGCPNLRRVIITNYVAIDYSCINAIRDFYLMRPNFDIEGIVKINTGMFSNCTSLREFKIPLSVMEIQDDAFAASGIEECIIPEGVKVLGANVFFNCNSLRVVSLPKSLEKVGSSLFCACGIAELHVHFDDPNNILTENDCWLYGVRDIHRCTLFVPADSVDKYRNHNFYSRFKEIVTEKNNGFKNR